MISTIRRALPRRSIARAFCISSNTFEDSVKLSIISDMFTGADADGSGALDRDEVKQHLASRFAEDQSKLDSFVEKFMERADTDEDGKISINEFIRVIVTDV